MRLKLDAGFADGASVALEQPLVNAVHMEVVYYDFYR